MKSKTLNELASKHGCDKSNLHHGYCDIYEKYISQFKNEKIEFLELGYGGYDDPGKGGESAKMWREYFTNANITIVELYSKQNVPEGIKLVEGSQSEYSTYEGLPDFDIILDDASHINSHTIASFKILWPKLTSGGLYIIEDLHSSYHYPYYPDANPNPDKGDTAMNFLKRLTDDINSDNLIEKYRLGYGIEFIHFYKDTVVIKKK